VSRAVRGWPTFAGLPSDPLLQVARHHFLVSDRRVATGGCSARYPGAVLGEQEVDRGSTVRAALLHAGALVSIVVACISFRWPLCENGLINGWLA